MNALPHDTMVRNILWTYLRAEPQEIAAGAAWYPEAHRIVVEWAETFDRSIANVASIVAAISPQCPWNRNLIIADDILRGFEPSTFGALRANLAKARLIRDERHSNTLTAFRVGCKVASFASNLAGDYETAVTIDTHAAQVAIRSVLATPRVDTWARYAPVVLAYRAAARELQLEPAILQAIVWVTWKRLHPPAQKRHARREF